MTSQTIPDRWKLTKISKIAVKGQQRKPDAGEQFTYVDIGSIDRNQKKIADPQTLNGSQAPSRARKVIEKGDVLVSLTRPNLNAVALVSQEYHNQIASTGFEVVRPLLVDSRYIFALVRSKQFVNAISGTVQGALYPAAKSADVQNFELPLPSLAEQKIIADKLDALLAQVESTKARLDRIPQILKRFRQSVLAAAVSGRLTEEWRNINQFSNIQNLLEQWKSQREQLKSEKRLKKNIGTKSNPSPLIEEVPKNWAWVNFEHIAEHSNNALKAGPFGSALKKSDCVTSGFRVYGQEQVISGNEKLVTYYVTEQKYEQLAACSVKPGDILISLVGTIGKVLVLSQESEAGIINPRLVKLSLQREVNRDYIRLFLESPIAHGFFRGFSHGGTMEILNLSILKELPIALPPLEEQTEIVRRVDQLFAYADHIEQQVTSALERVNNLTQSILAKAFRGELTEQWRKDNPELISGENSAAALLERIKAERAAMKPAKRSRKKTNA